jgi:hypothetical protein
MKTPARTVSTARAVNPLYSGKVLRRVYHRAARVRKRLGVGESDGLHCQNRRM